MNLADVPWRPTVVIGCADNACLGIRTVLALSSAATAHAIDHTPWFSVTAASHRPKRDTDLRVAYATSSLALDSADCPLFVLHAAQLSLLCVNCDVPNAAVVPLVTALLDSLPLPDTRVVLISTRRASLDALRRKPLFFCADDDGDAAWCRPLVRSTLAAAPHACQVSAAQFARTQTDNAFLNVLTHACRVLGAPLLHATAVAGRCSSKQQLEATSALADSFAAAFVALLNNIETSDNYFRVSAERAHCKPVMPKRSTEKFLMHQ